MKERPMDAGERSSDIVTDNYGRDSEGTVPNKLYPIKDTGIADKAPYGKGGDKS